MDRRKKYISGMVGTPDPDDDVGEGRQTENVREEGNEDEEGQHNPLQTVNMQQGQENVVEVQAETTTSVKEEKASKGTATTATLSGNKSGVEMVPKVKAATVSRKTSKVASRPRPVPAARDFLRSRSRVKLPKQRPATGRTSEKMKEAATEASPQCGI